MDSVAEYRDLIERILLEYAAIPYAYGEIECEAVADRVRDRYALINTGWDRGARVHGCLLHVDIINGKIWIQYDGTEEGIAKELTAAGVPRDRIVLAFHSPDVRKHTAYAVA